MKIIYLVLVYYVVVMGNTSLVLSDYIDEKRQLFDALQQDIINDSTNLYKLQEMFYPPGAVSPDTVELSFNVTVNTILILFPHNTTCGYEDPAFKNSSNHYVRNNITDDPIDRFTVSDDAIYNSQAKLTAYVNSIRTTLIEFESVSYYFIAAVTNTFLNSNEYTLNLKVDKLDVMPCEDDYVYAMNSVLSWARYYAKLYNHDPLNDIPSKLDTDRGITFYIIDYWGSAYDNIIYEDNDNSNRFKGFIVILYLLNILIAITGIYCLNLIITKYEPYRHTNSTRKFFNSIYGASVIIAGVINIGCLLVFGDYVIYHFRLPLMALIFLVETVAVFIVVKKFKIPSRVCGCCSRPFKLVMRLVHTLAICHLLWFLHRVGSGLIVAAFFIALAPGQTIAAFSLMYLVILVTIIYVACCIYSIQKKCIMIWKLFLLTITYLCLVGLAVVFTLYYLSKNGLTSSTMGSVLLSLIPPMAIFFIGVAIKRQLKESNILEIESSDSDLLN